MTFGIGFVSPSHAGIVTDRRVSGAAISDEADKCGYVTFDDGWFAYSLAGLAGVPLRGYWTQRSLARALCEAGRPDTPGGPPTKVRTALQRVADAMTSQFASLKVSKNEDKATSVLFAGFRWEDGWILPEAHLVSNYERLRTGRTLKVANHFWVDSEQVVGTTGPRCFMGWIGGADLSHDARNRIFPVLQDSQAPAAAIVEMLVAEIQSAALKDAGIGKRCSSIVVPARPDEQVVIKYHRNSPSDELAAVAHICAEYGNRGAYYWIDQRLSSGLLDGQKVLLTVPSVHRRQKCPCGSGRRYRHCHGNPNKSHRVDSYRFQGKFQIYAHPEDGSEMVIWSNAMFGQGCGQ